MANTASALFRFRVAMSLFIVGLVLSGVTAFPLLGELRILTALLGVGDAPGPEGHTGLAFWILTVRHGLEHTYARYPWLAYGTDWLAFGHLVIAMFFVGPLVNPRTSRATIYTGIVACLGVLPLALICGPIRGIPFYWRLVDCSFGVLGILPLLYCLRLLRQIEAKPPRGQNPEPSGPKILSSLAERGTSGAEGSSGPRQGDMENKCNAALLSKSCLRRRKVLRLRSG